MLSDIKVLYGQHLSIHMSHCLWIKNKKEINFWEELKIKLVRDEILYKERGERKIGGNNSRRRARRMAWINDRMEKLRLVKLRKYNDSNMFPMKDYSQEQQIIMP